MPRSFSRIAGKPPRTLPWCISSFGNVSSPERFSGILLLLQALTAARILAYSNARTREEKAMKGKEHWTQKGDVRLFMWQKAPAAKAAGTILFVHGSSMA